MITLQNLAAVKPAPYAASAPTPGGRDDAGTAPAQFAAVLAGQRAIAAGGTASGPVAATKHAPLAASTAKAADPADPATALPPGLVALVAGQRDVAGNGSVTPEKTAHDGMDAAAPAAPAAPAVPVAAAAPVAPVALATQDVAGNANGQAITAAIPLLPPSPAAGGSVTSAREAKPANPTAALHTEPPASGKPDERGRPQASDFEVRDSLRAPGSEAEAAGMRQLRPAGETDALLDYSRTAEQREPAPIVAASAHPQSQIREAVQQAPQSPQLDAPIGSARWGEQLSNQVIVLAQGGTASADIRVTPPELGPVHVRISVEDGIASVVLSAPAQETRQALEAALPALHDALAESGLSLGESAVSEEHFARQGETRTERESRESLGAESALTRDVAARPQRAGLLDMYA
ncbi:MAG: flagellar hook-length control protein FliK [Betaproteobacteria bacterium]|nr:flagellar hook-length control protein FliK [Betaproteobacteria bacterium]